MLATCSQRLASFFTMSLSVAPAELYQSLETTPPDPQLSSPLMTKLPPEVRNEIFKLALTEYVDPDATVQYSVRTCFTRPTYSAPRRTDTELLRTCRAIYNECWLMPHMLKEETHYMAWQDRAPPEYNRDRKRAQLMHRLDNIARNLRRLGQRPEERMEMDSLRIFAQLCEIEGGGWLRDIVGVKYFWFRRLTVTLRHSDWWNWEDDARLHIGSGRWIEVLSRVLPSSVTEVCLELETLERKKDQVDSIARQMSKQWYFSRKDGTPLFADTSVFAEEDFQDEEQAAESTEGTTAKRDRFVQRWSGSSFMNGQRWERDEAAPGRLDYYILTVPFKLQSAVEEAGGVVDPSVLRAAQAKDMTQVYRGVDSAGPNDPDDVPTMWEAWDEEEEEWEE